jgi:hypothetical protein
MKIGNWSKLAMDREEWKRMFGKPKLIKRCCDKRRRRRRRRRRRYNKFRARLVEARLTYS